MRRSRSATENDDRTEHTAADEVNGRKHDRVNGEENGWVSKKWDQTRQRIKKMRTILVTFKSYVNRKEIHTTMSLEMGGSSEGYYKTLCSSS